VGLNLNFARSLAHSGWRPDLNPADYPVFPGAVSIAGYNSAADFATAFSNALGAPPTAFGQTCQGSCDPIQPSLDESGSVSSAKRAYV
jgi:hypothetical protein